MATKIVDKLTVAASPPAAGGVLPLTFFDVPWIFTGPVERVFFYSYPHAVEHFTAHLASSLSAALHGFYPLLGRVRPCPGGGGGGGYEFCSTGGDADRVELTVAESDHDFEELAGVGPRDVGKLYSLVPRLPGPEDGSSALAAVQVTVFPNKGLAVGVSIHHVACDDSSFMHFVKTWAAHCRLAAGGDADVVPPPPPPPPFLDRGVVADPDGLAAKTLDQMRQLAASGPPPPPPSGPPPKLFMASFTLTRDCIDKLKQRVTASGGGGGIHCSSFTVACAYGDLPVDVTSAGRERAHLLFSVECRRRLTPPVPQEYLGNCLRPCFVEVDMAGLLGADGVVTAATGIGAAIRGLDDGVLDGADGGFQKIMSLLPHRPMSIGGSPRYGVYDTDFGLGRPRKVELLSIDKTPGTVSMAEGRDGHGGVEIGVALPEAEMAQFSSCFADGLKQL
uniref:Uncharacterized protein n=1 Tax=Oryza punctata TaxID=4537 RepID=A0A0E0K6Z9_ORYPU